VVEDDLAMRITAAVRGDDLLPSTPRQIALARALGAEPPRYLHLPLVLDAHGERLGKRHGAASLASLREAGVAPEAVVGRLAASLGLQAHDRPLRAAEVAARLAADPGLAHVARAPARVAVG
jgi:glutamyl-tRNA synthetase